MRWVRFLAVLGDSPQPKHASKETVKLSEYLKLSREERTEHVDLSTPCEVDEGVSSTTSSKRGRKALLEKFGLENDVENWKKGKVNCCHLCEHSSHNGWCTNLNHLYLGTVSENSFDRPEDVRKAPRGEGGKRTVELKVGLHDPKNAEVVREGRSKGGQAGATTTNAKRRLCLVTGHVSNPANLARYQRFRGVLTDLYYDLENPEAYEDLTPLQRLLAVGTEHSH